MVLRKPKQHTSNTNVLDVCLGRKIVQRRMLQKNLKEQIRFGATVF